MTAGDETKVILFFSNTNALSFFKKKMPFDLK